MLKLTCPNHNVSLVPFHTKFGTRWQCASIGCTVVCWNGSTSTPADQETRTARHQCHEQFDRLWKNGTFQNRSKAYDWLKNAMKIQREKAHIGMFSLEQCHQLLDLIRAGI